MLAQQGVIMHVGCWWPMPTLREASCFYSYFAHWALATLYDDIGEAFQA